MSQTEAKVAYVYADALADLASRESHAGSTLSLLEIDDQLQSCLASFQKEEKVWKFFSSPVVSWEDKKNAIISSLKGKVHHLLFHFFLVLSKRDRFVELPMICRLFHKEINSRLKRREVCVRSARELTQNEEENLKESLRKYLGCEIILEKKVSPELMGGLILTSEDLRLDSSVQSCLERIRSSLSQRGIRGKKSGEKFEEKFYEN